MQRCTPSAENDRYTNLSPLENCGDLVRRLGTSKYLISPFGSRSDRHGNCWRRPVSFRTHVYVDEGEGLKSRDWAASDAFHPDPLGYWLLPEDGNAYGHRYDMPMFRFLTPIKTDFQAAHRCNVHCRDYVFDAVIVDTAASLVTAEVVPFALQSTPADGQYLHQHLG